MGRVTLGRLTAAVKSGFLLCAGLSLILGMIPPGRTSALASSWAVTGPMHTEHWSTNLTKLSDGRAMTVTGNSSLPGTEVYDPTTQQWTQVGNVNVPRDQFNPVLLDDGRVLIAGGNTNPGPIVATSELFDPATGQWTLTGSLNSARTLHFLVKLVDGRVLAIGGSDPSNNPVMQSEIYDPATGQWTYTGSLNAERGQGDGSAESGGAILLNDGKVLVTGDLGEETDTAELYDPATGQWSYTGSLHWQPTATHLSKLHDGRILASGGHGVGTYSANTEIYDPTTGQWSVTGSLHTQRGSGFGAGVLPDGRVLVAGGLNQDGYVMTSEIYDPATGQWSVDASVNHHHHGGNMVVFNDGTALIAGGFTTVSELYTPAVVNTVSGTVYIDANNNGTRDEGEQGYEGATVRLYSGHHGYQIVSNQSTTTDANGNYSMNIPNLVVHWLKINVPEGYQGTNKGIWAFGDVNTVQDFGINTPSILPTVFEDEFEDEDGTTLVEHNSEWTVNQEMPTIQNNRLQEPSTGSSDPTGPFGYVMSDQCMSVDILTPTEHGVSMHIRQSPVGAMGGYGSHIGTDPSVPYYDLALYKATTGDPYFPGGFSIPKAILSDGLHNLRTCAIGNQIATYLDNALMIKATDTDWTDGIAHMGIIRNTVLDNFKLEGVLLGPAVYNVATNTRSTSGNNNVVATVGAVGVPTGDTATVSVATGTFAGAVGCSDSKGNTYSIVADRNSGQGRLFVCSSHITTPLTAGDTVTATYPVFSGISVVSLNAIASHASGGTVIGASSANGNSATPNSGNITVGVPAVLFGVIDHNSTPTFTAGVGYTVVGQVSGGTGSAKRNISPEFKVVSSAGSYSANGTISNGGQFWRAAVVGYQE